MIKNLLQQDPAAIDVVLKILAIVSDPAQALAAAKDLSEREAALAAKEVNVASRLNDVNAVFDSNKKIEADLQIKHQKCDALMNDYQGRLAKLKAILS